ncbi:MAG: hypothetical protein R2684_04530 [Pyrinomonadaceae bacterium]
MNRFVTYCVLNLLAICCVFTSARADTPSPPWSEVVTSSNGKYALVLISPKVSEQNDYVVRSREFWQRGGIPSENVSEAEEALEKEIRAEATIRRKYTESGLYTVESTPRLLWRIELYDITLWKRVSNDGVHVVVGRTVVSGITKEKALEYAPGIKEVATTYPNLAEDVLMFYSLGKLIRSYKASDLTSINENMIQTTSNDFMWSDEGELRGKEEQLVIIKKDKERLVFDIVTGSLLSGMILRKSTPESSEGDSDSVPKPGSDKSFCGGIALLLGIVLFVVGR